MKINYNYIMLGFLALSLLSMLGFGYTKYEKLLKEKENIISQLKIENEKLESKVKEYSKRNNVVTKIVVNKDGSKTIEKTDLSTTDSKEISLNYEKSLKESYEQKIKEREEKILKEYSTISINATIDTKGNAGGMLHYSKKPYSACLMANKEYQGLCFGVSF